MSYSWSQKPNDHIYMGKPNKWRVMLSQHSYTTSKTWAHAYITRIYSICCISSCVWTCLPVHLGPAQGYLMECLVQQCHYSVIMSIANYDGFSSLPWVKLRCFLLPPFHKLIHEKHCLSCLPLGSSCLFIFGCCPFEFPLPGLCCSLPVTALCHHHFNCLTETKSEGCRARFCITVSFQGQHVS